MIKLIIFDWDDVITLGSKEGYFACYHKMLEEVGVSLDPEEERRRILMHWGKKQTEEIVELLKERPELIEKACEIYEENLFGETFLSHLSLVNGAVDALSKLKGKYILTVASGAHPKVLKEKVMPMFHIPDVFAEIITSYDVDDAHAKPHPYMAEEIMRRQNVLPSEAVLVGDSKSDIQMALAAKVTPIVVLTGHLSREQAEELGVKYITDDITKLEEIVNSL